MCACSTRIASFSLAIISLGMKTKVHSLPFMTTVGTPGLNRSARWKGFCSIVSSGCCLDMGAGITPPHVRRCRKNCVPVLYGCGSSNVTAFYCRRDEDPLLCPPPRGGRKEKGSAPVFDRRSTCAQLAHHQTGSI